MRKMRKCKLKFSTFPYGLLVAVAAILVGNVGGAAEPQTPPPPAKVELWDMAWQVDGGSVVWTNDAVLKRRVAAAVPDQRKPVTLTSEQVFSGAYGVEAMVRCPPGSVALEVGAAGTNACYWVNLSTGRAAGLTARSVQFGGKAAEGGWPCPAPKPRFTPDGISPTMDEQQRISLENDFTDLPQIGPVGSWHRVRFEVRPDEVVLYIDGLLQGQGPNLLKGEGAVRVSMSGEGLLDGLLVRPLPAAPGMFQTAPLDGLVNAGDFVDPGSIGKPDASGVVTVGGVPFLIPEAEAGRDHVDIGVSRFRYNRQWGYAPASKPTDTYVGPDKWDPSELKFYVPHQAYGRVWVLAAADGEPNSTPVLTVRFFKPEVS